MPRLAPVTSATEPSMSMVRLPSIWMMVVILLLKMMCVIHTVGMGHSQEDKARNHDRIVQIASGRIRESGTAAPGVAEIMQAAGLTHGGFYKHFDSREDLIAEAAGSAFADGRRAMAA